MVSLNAALTQVKKTFLSVRNNNYKSSAMTCESRVERDEHVTNRTTVEAAAEAGTAF